VPPGYDAFFEQAAAAAADVPAPVPTPAATVAQVILAAATDGTSQLRYLVGQDTRGFIAAWETMPRADYLAYLRAQFGAE
jgi:hypothetical protein